MEWNDLILIDQFADELRDEWGKAYCQNVLWHFFFSFNLCISIATQSIQVTLGVLQY